MGAGGREGRWLLGVCVGGCGGGYKSSMSSCVLVVSSRLVWQLPLSSRRSGRETDRQTDRRWRIRNQSVNSLAAAAWSGRSHFSLGSRAGVTVCRERRSSSRRRFQAISGPVRRKGQGVVHFPMQGTAWLRDTTDGISRLMFSSLDSLPRHRANRTLRPSVQPDMCRPGTLAPAISRIPGGRRRRLHPPRLLVTGAIWPARRCQRRCSLGRAGVGGLVRCAERRSWDR